MIFFFFVDNDEATTATKMQSAEKKVLKGAYSSK